MACAFGANGYPIGDYGRTEFVTYKGLIVIK